MPQFLKSKHQKLILQCYPSGRDIDKKPNSSELSYLLYYASTRRVKLEKVGNFIEKKTISDLHHFSRYGNVQVSLLIIKNLIEKCSDNLNVFANNIVIIFRSILLTNDLILAQLALKVFKVFCNHLDNNLFIGDREFVNNFTESCELFLDLGNKNYKKGNPDTTNNQWQILSIKAAKYLSSIVGFNISKNNPISKAASQSTTLEGDYLVNRSFDLILSILNQNFSIDDLAEKLINLDQRTHKRIATNTNIKANESNLGLQSVKSNTTLRRSVSISRSLAGGNTATSTDNNTEDNIKLDTEWTNLDCAEDALNSLKAYFSTTVSYELNSSLKSINAFIYTHAGEGLNQWSNLLIQIIVNWVPVQLRFLVLTFLINRLLKASDLETVSSTGNKIGGGVTNANSFTPMQMSNNSQNSLPNVRILDYQIALTYIISGLLNSKVNMIGLSVLDILKNLVNLQSNLIKWKANDPARGDVYDLLSNNYISCISSLTKHIYYHDQISDIIEELLIRINETFTYNIGLKSHSEEVDHQIQALFADINTILDNCIAKEEEDEGIQIYGEQLLTTNDPNKKNQQELFALVKQNSPVFISTWLSFSLYLNNDRYSNLQTHKSLVLQFYQILIKLLSIQLGFEEEKYITELLSSDEFSFDYDSLRRSITNYHNMPKFKTETPNYSNLIFNSNMTSNFLNELLANFDNILNFLTTPEQKTKDAQLLKYILIVKTFILEIFGINFIYNGLDYFLNWQITDDKLTSEANANNPKVLKDSFGYNLLLKSVEYLDLKCKEDEVLNDENDPFKAFLNEIFVKVRARIQGRIWDTQIPLNHHEIQNQQQQQQHDADISSKDLIFTKEDLLGFFNQSKFTSKWIVDVFAGTHSKHHDLPYSNLSSGNSNLNQQNGSNGAATAGTTATNTATNSANGLGNPSSGGAGLENASILSTSRLVANLTNNNTILSSNLTGSLAILNGTGGKNNLFDNNTINGTNGVVNGNQYSSLRVHDLKNVVSRSNLLDSHNATTDGNRNGVSPVEVNNEEVVANLKQLVAGLKFSDDKFNNGKLSF